MNNIITTNSDKETLLRNICEKWIEINNYFLKDIKI